MSFNKEFWKNLCFIKNEEFPHINCPLCKKGYLKPIKESFRNEETRFSKSFNGIGYWNSSWEKYRFTIIFECSNSKCKDVVACLGNGYIEEDAVPDKYGNLNLVIREIYKPIHFFPSIEIIPVLTNYPDKIKTEVFASFSHFFSDLTSCANKIRICIEILMDEMKIRKTSVDSGKRKILNLHQRILAYEKRNPEFAAPILALKWIGNAGSHYDKLTIDDILDAYSLLDYSLSNIFENKAKEIEKLTKEINKKKGPKSRKKG